MSKFSIFSGTRLVALSVLGMAVLPFSSMAADGSLKGWITDSRVLVNQYMTYPRMAVRRDETGVSYVRVTIDRDGNLLKYVITGKSGSSMLDRASLRTVKKIKQFPAIPIIYRDDQMTFGVKLRYDIAYSSIDYRKKMKKTKVTMRALGIASSSPMSAEIVILAAD